MFFFRFSVPPRYLVCLLGQLIYEMQIAKCKSTPRFLVLLRKRKNKLAALRSEFFRTYQERTYVHSLQLRAANDLQFAHEKRSSYIVRKIARS